MRNAEAREVAERWAVYKLRGLLRSNLSLWLMLPRVIPWRPRGQRKLMQFLNPDPLIEDFRARRFDEAEVGPYFLATMILAALIAIYPASSADDGWDVLQALSTAVITLFGILHLRKRNGDTFGDGFLAKYFSLGWVVGIRLLLFAIPLTAVVLALAAISGGRAAFDPALLLLTVGLEVTFYVWLGQLIERTLTKAQDPFGKAMAPEDFPASSPRA